MDLFKRILLSIFPDDVVNQPINPISMFVSFISSKQFFSVINRKIVENYKLNLFDISLDSFEVKIWFGEHPNIKVKDIDFYYSYAVVSNFNWYRFLSPSNLWNSISMVTALLLVERFRNYKYTYFINFILAIYLLWFCFTSRIKVFPYDELKKDYEWFIELFFDFYKLIFEQTWEKINPEILSQIKNELLNDIHVFFMLYYYYKNLGNVLYYPELTDKEFYSWLFYDELRKWSYKFLLLDFLNDYESYSTSNSFSWIEKKMLNLVFPADVLLKYLADWEDVYLIVKYVLWDVYDINILNSYTKSFLKDDSKLEEFIYYITDYNNFKNSYFKWIKKFIIHKFKDSDKYDANQEIEEFISTIWNNPDLDNIQIPERIKKESAIMEKFINFYMTYIWWFWVARWDNYNFRLFRKWLLNELLSYTNISMMKQDILFFYWSLLYNYSKNVFYYKYVTDNVRAGKDKFNLPFKSNFREVYSNMYIIKLFNENFISNILQDLNSKDIKIYIQNKEILKEFKNLFWNRISKVVSKENKHIINIVYKPITTSLKDIYDFHDIVRKYTNCHDITNLKESFYNLDFWLWHDLIWKINESEIDLSLEYSDFSILGILSFFRDTWFAFVIFYYNMLVESSLNKDWINYWLDEIKKVYFLDVVWLWEGYFESFSKFLDDHIKDYSKLLDMWLKLDNNEKFFNVWIEDWLNFIDEKNLQKNTWELWWEDIVWFRWYLKNITFYNKRYLIPKE